MSQFFVDAGSAVNATGTGNITTANCALIGFYVNNTTAGTLVIRRGGSGGTVISGTITPAIGFHRFPAMCSGGVHITVGGAIDVTFFVVEGAA